MRLLVLLHYILFVIVIDEIFYLFFSSINIIVSICNQMLHNDLISHLVVPGKQFNLNGLTILSINHVLKSVSDYSCTNLSEPDNTFTCCVGLLSKRECFLLQRWLF